MRVINIIKDIQPIRMGVFMAATNTATYLLTNYNVVSELWFPGSDYGQEFPFVTKVSLTDTSLKELKRLIEVRQLDPLSDIIVTHSPWNYQSRWGNYLAKKGFTWIFLAHGTLQPTYLAQKWLKKVIYYRIFERKYLENTTVIRAISLPEKINLENKFPRKKIALIPNGSHIESLVKIHATSKISFLYLSRLHHQKKVVELSQAWISSSLNNNAMYELIIAGPNDGELQRLQAKLKQSSNINYVGAVYGTEKEYVFNKCSFFILPSIGEGFPVSIVEAAGKGLIPIITTGCNFPELLNAGLAIQTEPEPKKIKISLEQCASMSEDFKNNWSRRIMQFMKNNYSLEIIAEKQFALYKCLLP